MQVLDLYSCQGGAGYGYRLAGAEVTGVDLSLQPRYPLKFVQADALKFVKEYDGAFDFIHASPPCQFYSATQRIQQNDHPDLIGPTRDALNATGQPWVIENVADALPWMRNPVMLCGAMFGLHTYRHRYFETGGGFTFTAPEHPEHVHPTVKMGRPVREGDWYHAVGNFSGVAYIRRDMNVPWMNRDGIRECIPPAYTQYVGTQFKKGAAMTAEQIAAEAAAREAERLAAEARVAQALADAQRALDQSGVSIPPGAWGH
jgi:DNA (cytosine-5)-methyltransferase 1